MTALPIWHRPSLGPLLMMQMFDRLCPGTFKGRREPAVSRLGKEAWNDAAYCIDAPDELPAGGCYQLELEYGYGITACQLTVERDDASFRVAAATVDGRNASKP